MSQSINCSNIASSKIQKCFAVLESTAGEFARPGREHFVAVTSDATANQAPEFSNSGEKLGTRDVTERFAGAMPAATAKISMYLNVCETGEKPQGYDLITSLFGSSTLINPPVFTLAEADESATNLALASIADASALPACGVISLNGEDIYYDALSEDKSTLTGCVRGYNSTVPAYITANSAGIYKSIAFKQANCNPAFSLYLQTDHLLQCITGCTINEATLSLSNEGAVSLEFGSIQGMRMVIAGTGKVTGSHPAASTVIAVEDPGLFMVDAPIWCPTVEDQGSGHGYIVTAVDDNAKTITLDNPTQEIWPDAAVICGWLPQDAQRIGEPLKGGDTEVYLDGIRSKLRSSTLSYRNNISYITDELGTTHPESYVEDARNIETSMNSYFRAQDAARFKEGLNGKTIHARYCFGKNKAAWDMPKVQMTTPQTTINAPTVSLDSNGTALASGKGNNAAEFIVN